MKDLKYGALLLRAEDDGACCTVVGCEAGTAAIEIPAAVDGMPVVGIDDRAFENCKTLSAVTFDGALERDPLLSGEEFSVGDAVFAGCTALKEIVLPAGVTFLGWGAFRDCTALERVEMPDCLCSSYVFCRCENLKEITPITDITEGMFSHCAALSTFPVAPETTVIGEDAFEHCDALTEIAIPAAVEEIGQLAFRNCFGLTAVTFENTDGWYWTCTYDSKDRALDVTDPAANARDLASADFDDGVTRWYRK